MNQVTIQTENGNAVHAYVFPADSNQVLIIASATGVKQHFYRRFARYVSGRKVNVITFDYSGIGLSLQNSVKQTQTSAIDWGKNDLEAVINFAAKSFPNSRITLLGHSIGGQLIGLAPSSKTLHKVVLVASPGGYWGLWDGLDKMKMWFYWHILFPTLSTTFGYLPSKKLSRMENLPKGVAIQWSRWGRKPEFLFDEISESDLYYDDIEAPVTSIWIDKDVLAPRRAVDWLTHKYRNADIKKLHLYPGDFNSKEIGHFGIFNEQFKHNLWPMLAREVAIHRSVEEYEVAEAM